MTDANQRIADLGKAIEACMEMAEREGWAYFHWRGLAERHLREMESLIRARSESEVARLELERGLV